MELHQEGIYIQDGKLSRNGNPDKKQAKRKTMAGQILEAHDDGSDPDHLHLKFDSLTSHDITYVGIIQTARASGLKEFPVPYVMTNCHNSLCAVGGTINEDDHRFALSAAHKYGGIYVPANLAVIHSYNREMMSGAGRMILGSDSHTRYGALGTMGVGEGGGELAKQLLGRRYEAAWPDIVLVYLKGKLRPGVGPHDVSLALVGAVYANGFVKNAVLEFAGPGIASLSQDFRNGIDVMTTETTCWSSIWETDDTTRHYFEQHDRPEAYKPLHPQDGAYYDRYIVLDLSDIESMIALPMHPSYAVSVHALQKDPYKYLGEAQARMEKQFNGRVRMNLLNKIDEKGRIHVDQGIIAGCAGGIFSNIAAAAAILKGKNTGNGEFRLSVYPDSMPVYKALADQGILSSLLDSGAVFREAFCGPCFGAGETPANEEFSIRHTTRNFPNREGSKPNEGQIAAVGLMDARSIAATAANQGVLTAGEDVVQEEEKEYNYFFDKSIYEHRVYNGFGHAESSTELIFGPNIKDWPEMPLLKENLLVQIDSHIDDPVTTTDELIPSGETSSYRSNPLRLAEFTLSRRDPAYVNRAKATAEIAHTLETGKIPSSISHIQTLLNQNDIDTTLSDTLAASAIYANKPGDGSAREQAASCQRVLGGAANFAHEYATKRYRSNCINWGIIPFLIQDENPFTLGAWVFIPRIREALINHNDQIDAFVIHDQKIDKTVLHIGELSDEERTILLDGCLINYYRFG